MNLKKEAIKTCLLYTSSKSNDLEITALMLETKSEIEKIREQVQNIE